MAIIKLEHVGVMVKDLGVSLDFYQKILGLDLLDKIEANPEVTLAFLGDKQTGQVYVELVHGRKNEFADDGKVNHIAFTVDNIEDEVQRLKSLNVSFFDDTILTIENKSKYVFFKGPDGEKLELFEPLSDLKKDPQNLSYFSEI